MFNLNRWDSRAIFHETILAKCLILDRFWEKRVVL
jgi:hypothetical protein